MEYVNTFDKQLSNLLNEYVKKPTIVRGIVHLLLILYSARLAPSLPQPVLVLFENQYFKLFIFSLILWSAQFSPSTSILIALAFMVTVNYSTNKSLWEFLENVEEQEQMTTAQQLTTEAPLTTTAQPLTTAAQPLTTAVPITAAVTEAPKAAVSVSEPAECYPVRRYDMSKVEPSGGDSSQQAYSK